MSYVYQTEEAVKHRHLNSVLVNVHPTIFDKAVLRTEANKKLYVNFYDYVASQLHMFLLKAIYPERDLNSYLYAKEFLESFANKGNLKHLNSMVTNYKKVFQWFIFDLTVVRYKTVTLNTDEHFVDIVPTLPKIMWEESGSEGLRGKYLEFDFKEKYLTELQDGNFNCIVLRRGVVEEFIDRCHRGDIDLMVFSSDLLLNKIPLIDDWYSLDELYNCIMETSPSVKQNIYATTLLYTYLNHLELVCLIDQR